MKSRFSVPFAIVSVSTLLFLASCSGAAAKVAPAPSPIETVSNVSFDESTVLATSESDLKNTVTALQAGQLGALASTYKKPIASVIDQASDPIKDIVKQPRLKLEQSPVTQTSTGMDSDKVVISYDKMLSSDFLTYSGIDDLMKNNFKGTVNVKGEYSFPKAPDGSTLDYAFTGYATLDHDIDVTKLMSAIASAMTPPSSGTPVSVTPSITLDQLLSNKNASINCAYSGQVILVPGTKPTTGACIEKAVFRMISVKNEVAVKGFSYVTSKTSAPSYVIDEISVKPYASIDAVFVVSSKDASIKGGKIGISLLFDKGITFKQADLDAAIAAYASGNGIPKTLESTLSSKGLSLKDAKISVKVWDNANIEVFSKEYTALEFINTYPVSPVVVK